MVMKLLITELTSGRKAPKRKAGKKIKPHKKSKRLKPENRKLKSSTKQSNFSLSSLFVFEFLAKTKGRDR